MSLYPSILYFSILSLKLSNNNYRGKAKKSHMYGKCFDSVEKVNRIKYENIILTSFFDICLLRIIDFPEDRFI